MMRLENVKIVSSLPLTRVCHFHGDGLPLGCVVGRNDLRSQSDVEIKIERVYTVSRANVILPFSVEDAARSEAEVEASQVGSVFLGRQQFMEWLK